ncbi:helix-turn-helix domain-containing protein [Actinospica sp.]|uniref:helix-turn-helix domain-containing protein n=1 Tax=Actinospica sp. TaxID=1872142 RepID=UPI002BB4BACE|nr:helix-turn-helix domain-containing protein [Actinospica sp.]HWG26195.1 helix-turn-helix domain-containing protein [Actinospica sp.]
MDEADWTLDELARRARHVLAADDVRAPNGRVRELGTDGRAIRWYAMKGLVDRPTIGPGHAARYGPRHLTQLVAVKRLQAQGMTLAEIQRVLAGATDETLGRIADLGELEFAAEEEMEAADNESAVAAIAEQPEAAPSPVAAGAGAGAATAAAVSAAPRRFWAAPMAVHGSAAADVRYLITLTEGVTLTLPAQPGAADLAAVREAAAPLLALLADRGLTTPPPEPRP